MNAERIVKSLNRPSELQDDILMQRDEMGIFRTSAHLRRSKLRGRVHMLRTKCWHTANGVYLNPNPILGFVAPPMGSVPELSRGID